MRLRIDHHGLTPGAKLGFDGPSGVRHFFRSSMGFVADVPEGDARALLAQGGFVAIDHEPEIVTTPVYDLQHIDRDGLNALAKARGRKFHHKTSDAKVREELAAMLAKEATDADDAGDL